MNNRALRFDKASVILADPLQQSRSSAAAILRSLGIATLAEVDSLESLRTRLAQGSADLLVVDLAFLDDGLLDMLAGLRRGRLGAANPFMAIIATTWKADPAILSRAVDVGCDGILVQPLSFERLRTRIHSLAEGTRSYLVSASYVGPDRRSAARAVPLGPSDEMTPVNTLALKARGIAVNEDILREDTATLKATLARYGAQASAGDNNVPRRSSAASSAMPHEEKSRARA